MATNDKPDAQNDALFQRESLTLKQIINIARGAPIKDWPPPEPFLGLFKDMKDSVGRDETPAARYPLFERFNSVRLPDLQHFLHARERDKRWGPIHDACEQWAIGRGITARSIPKHLDSEARTKGGRVPKYDKGLQQFIDHLFTEFKGKSQRLTLSNLVIWLEANAARQNDTDENSYDPEPPIPDCGDIQFYDDKIWWIDKRGHQQSAARRTVERYISRARNRAAG